MTLSLLLKMWAVVDYCRLLIGCLVVAVDDDTAGSAVADAVDIDDTAVAAVDIVADPMIGKGDFAPDSNSLIAD